MRYRLAVCGILLALLLSSCGPSAEQIATMTASAWTPTPPPPTPTPTATPVPYGLTAIITDESGAPIPAASIVLPQSGSEDPVQADEAGKFTWPNLPGPDVSLKASAPGYLPGEQSGSVDRGTSELAVVLKRDAFGLLPADACASGEKLLYIEDFQDGKAQGWRKITGAVEFGAKNGWMLGPMEQGNNAVYFTGIYHDLDALQDLTFDNLVWRLKVMTTGKDGSSSINLKLSHPTPEGGTRYVIGWGADVELDLTRMQLPDVGAFSVGQSKFKATEGQWYYVEFSDYQGHVQVWIDGKQEIDYQDPKPIGPGIISLEVNILKDPQTMYAFDNLSVCELTAPFSTSIYKPAQ
jgi:hypothetical protein